MSHIVDTLEIEPGMDILDVGCGTGVLFDMLRRIVGVKGTVTGVDFSIQMARVAHRNFPFPNVNVVDADTLALPFSDSSFDMATSFSAFPHFANQQLALNEVDRVLKPGAKFCIIHLISSAEISDLHHREGGPIEDDELPTADKMREMFDASEFTFTKIEDHAGLYMACGVNSKSE